MILGSVLLNCAAQLLIRKGMLAVGETGIGNMASNLGAMLGNLWLWAAMVCYAYPFLSIGYVVAAIVGWQFFGESLSMVRIAGILVICFGVVLISRS